MNQYMIALKGGFDNWSSRSEMERKEVMTQFQGWAKRLSEDEGRYKDCARPVGENRCITKNGSSLLVDGHFPETKEVFTGFFIIRAENLEHATELAKGCPTLGFDKLDIFELEGDRS